MYLIKGMLLDENNILSFTCDIYCTDINHMKVKINIHFHSLINYDKQFILYTNNL